MSKGAEAISTPKKGSAGVETLPSRLTALLLAASRRCF
jgi:hypothetical protein